LGAGWLGLIQVVDEAAASADRIARAIRHQALLDPPYPGGEVAQEVVDLAYGAPEPGAKVLGIDLGNDDAGEPGPVPNGAPSFPRILQAIAFDFEDQELLLPRRVVGRHRHAD